MRACALVNLLGGPPIYRRSRTNTSSLRLVSCATRLSASDSNATYRPVAETAGLVLSELACCPVAFTDTRRVTPRYRSRTNTSSEPLVSSATRFDTREENASIYLFAADVLWPVLAHLVPYNVQ